MARSSKRDAPSPGLDGSDWYRAEVERERRAVKDFVEGALAANLVRMFCTFNVLTDSSAPGCGWRGAFRSICRVSPVPQKTREFFLQVFLDDGDSIRNGVDDDLVLADGLRALLPRYSGRGRTLYRGEGAENRRCRRYGLSWSATKSVARAHAETGFYRTSKGGSVLLVTRASAKAIICAPGQIDDRFDEQEYIVDRRFLKRVEVLARFPELTSAEFDAMRNETGSR